MPSDPWLLRKEGFKCDESFEYIPQQFVCDGHRDCEGGGEDEMDEACANKSELVSFFPNFSFIVHLHVNRNNTKCYLNSSTINEKNQLNVATLR